MAPSGLFPGKLFIVVLGIISFSFTISAQTDNSRNENNINNDTSKVSRFIREWCIEFNRHSELKVTNNIEVTLDSLEQLDISVLFSEISVVGVNYTDSEIGCVFTEIEDRRYNRPFIYCQVVDAISSKVAIPFKRVYIIQGKGTEKFVPRKVMFD